jgi:multiple sugar transport system substrate-binding protein
MPALIIYSLWHEVGFTTIVFLGGLAIISEEYGEAARVDGCGPGREFWYITWPQLRPVTTFVVIITTIGSLQAFTQFFELSEGGPNNVTTTLSYLVYQEGIVIGNTGYGAARAVVLFAITAFVTLVRRQTVAPELPHKERQAVRSRYAWAGPASAAAAAAAGRAPTIGQAYEDEAQTFAQAGSIVPISQLAGTAKPAELSTFYAGVQKDLYLPDGKMWMWPFSKSLQLLFYNASLLKQDGIAVPTTWPQFISALKTTSKDGVVGTTIDPGSAAGQTSGEEWLEELAAANGTPVSTASGAPQFTSPAAESAMSALVSLKKAGALATGTNFPGETALGAKKGPVDISSSAGYFFEAQAVGNKFPLTTTALPSGTAGAPDEMGGGNIVAFASATAEQKAAAWKFTEYLATPQVQAEWSSATGYYPETAQALTQPAMAKYLAANPWVKTTIGGLNSAITDPPETWITACGGDLSNALSAALSGTSPASALQTAQTACASAKSSA